ncbi:transmembrane protein 241 isoform X2 [Gymnodraco acuticeps]|uniref:Transmembrane protein 241 isoform X2 n=1 Tax=Gymnodraco acuticeps TaxID=8218 RepID=A0A6P8TUH0_GYMAC|nr:transmembrane protein 241 isoform X2 [Gymnodraco acuticeps]
MQWRKHITGLAFSIVFVVSYFTNKFVLSVLKFTYPTLFQGWQTFVGALLLLLSGKFGWVEMSRITRSAALSCLPGSLLFVGNIYAGSRALSRIDIPFFFTLQNSSHVVSYIILKVVHRETQWLKLFSICFMLLSAINLPMYDPQFDISGYLWAVGHLLCVGGYRVFQVHYKSSNLSDLEQQCINYLFSVLLLAIAAHPSGDLMGAMEFPSLQSYTFHCGCCASALLGFLLLLATVKLKSRLTLEHFEVWIFLSKITAMFLSPFVFNMDINTPSLICVVTSHVGEALLVYSQRDSQL